MVEDEELIRFIDELVGPSDPNKDPLFPFKEANPNRGFCSRIRFPFGVCNLPTTHHVIWDPETSSGICAEHADEVRARGDFLAIHPYDHQVCPELAATFDAERNCCVVKYTEKQIQAAMDAEAIHNIVAHLPLNVDENLYQSIERACEIARQLMINVGLDPKTTPTGIGT